LKEIIMTQGTNADTVQEEQAGRGAELKAQAGEALHAARDKVSHAYEAATERASSAYTTAREKTHDTYAAAREKTAETYSAARERSAAAYHTARERASDARRKAAEGIDENPALALVGGLAIGALLGALLPRSRREEEALSAVGERLRAAAGEALGAAKEAGWSKLDELGLNRQAATEKAHSLIDGAVAAAGSAGTAAVKAVRKEDAA
jgi:ElaB/YqjD/DUF883 family membrane-anchored ribosome-binding protein